MKRSLFSQTMLLLAMFLGTLPLAAQSYEKLWREVEEQQKKDLPETVIRLSENIFRKAERENNFQQKLKAYLTRMTSRAAISRDSLYTDIRYLNRWAEAESNRVNRAVLFFVQGKALCCIEGIYGGYEGGSATLDKLSEWSFNALKEYGWQCYEKAFADIAALGKTHVDNYSFLIEKGEDSALFGHDLLSLMLFDLKQVNADRRSDSLMYRFYDEAIAYYQDSGNNDAFYMMKLQKAIYEYCYGVSESRMKKEIRLADSVRAWTIVNEKKHIAPYLYHGYLNGLQNPGDSLEYVVSSEALAKYPNYKYADFFKMRRDYATSPFMDYSWKNLSLAGEKLQMNLRYRSINKLNVRIVDEKTNQVVQECNFVLNMKAPYAYEDTVLVLKSLPKPGIYRAEVNDGKAEAHQRLNYTTLYPILRLMPDRSVQVLVVDSRSGHPVEGAKVEIIKQDNSLRKPVFVSLAKSETNAKGEWLFDEYKEQKNLFLLVSKESCGRTDTLSFSKWYMLQSSETESLTSVNLFTDRAVYRPGQVMQISGLIFEGSDKQFKTTEGCVANLEVQDNRGKVLFKKQLKTNNMGSFSTQMILPETCMPGTLLVRCNKETITCRVEEYKRPAFEVKMYPIEDLFALGDTIRLWGKATNYMGMAVEDAIVKCTVNRNAYSFRLPEEEKPLVFTAVTDETGEFCIPLFLKPVDNLIKWQDVFYEARVEVTGSAGETQEESLSFQAGHHSANIRVNTGRNSWMKENPDSILVTVRNSAWNNVDMEGVYKVCPVKQELGKDDVEGEPVLTGMFKTNRFFVPKGLTQLPSGKYVVKAEVKDHKNRLYDSKSELILFGKNDKKAPVKEWLWYYADEHKIERGKPVTLYLGTAGEDVFLYYNVFSKDKCLESKYMILTDTLMTLRYENRPEYADGILVQWMTVRNGEQYKGEIAVAPATKDRNLQLKWETFRNKLRPGEKEEWRLKILMPDGKPADAELLTTLYDASLDVYSRLYWNLYVNESVHIPYVPFLHLSPYGENRPICINPDVLQVNKYDLVSWIFDRWGKELQMLARRFVYDAVSRRTLVGSVMNFAAPKVMDESKETEFRLFEQEVESTEEVSAGKAVETDRQMRQNFSETAFFYPHIRTDKDGVATLSFTLPESLTTWRFLGLAHTKDMCYGLVEEKVVANKEFMLQLKLPRFLRAGDEAVLPATIYNRSGKMQKGVVRMELFDPQTEKVYASKKQNFTVEAGKSVVVFFEVNVEQVGLLACRMVAQNKEFGDGEQRYLPVLSNKEWITESKMITVNKTGRQSTDLQGLFNSGSDTATERRLTVEFTSNPVWYAVMALPSLAEPLQQDALSLAAAYYAVRLGGWIAASYPRIQEVCRAWKAQGGNAETLWSQLQKNWELKNLLLEETPWLKDAANEKEQRNRLATLFDINSMDSKAGYYFEKLKALQRGDGAWSWYEGMPGSRYITTSITEMLVRLNALTDGRYASEMDEMMKKGINYLVTDMVEEYRRSKKDEENGKTGSQPSEMTLHFLYLNSLSNIVLTEEKKEAQNYFIQKLADMPADLTIFGKSLAAVVLHRMKKEEKSRSFLQSVLEYAVQSPEMGRYYDAGIARYSWADYRIPTQVMVMEACRELGVDEAVVQEYSQWLLKQKQVQAWNNPFNSVNAVYALLKNCSSWLDASEPAELFLDGKQVKAEDEASVLGYIKEIIHLDKKDHSPRILTVKSKADKPAWGAVYAQYLEELDKVSAHTSGLKVERRLLVRRVLDGKEQWQEVKSGEVLSVGDKVQSRVMVSTDRDLDFVQIEDKQAACMEQGVVSSGYRWSEGMGYYRVVKDASVRYFVDSFRKGTHVFIMEYVLTTPGTYRLGVATAQSAYAPELNAHSAGAVLTVE